MICDPEIAVIKKCVQVMPLHSRNILSEGNPFSQPLIAFINFQLQKAAAMLPLGVLRQWCDDGLQGGMNIVSVI